MGRTEISESDREQVAAFVELHWHSKKVMSAGKAYYPHEEEGFLESRNGEIVGLLTYHIESGSMEILTLNSTLSGEGIGSSLMLNAIDRARERGCHRIWLTTTNDLLRAIGFYQRLCFRMVAIHIGAVDEARKIKPQIPVTGERGVPIHDEIVMELALKPYLDEKADSPS